MKPAVLVDTGPLVALLNVNDAAHERCKNTLASLDPPLLTTWPVLTEAAWLLRSRPGAVAKLLRSVEDRLIRLAWMDSDEDTAGMIGLANAYADQEFQLADLTLMHLANRNDITTVFTLDVRDFSIFRKKDGTTLKIIPDA